MSCDEGKCPIQETVTLILPDISYRHLDPIIQYFYTGDLVLPASEKAVISDLLFRLFRIPPDRENAVPSVDRVAVVMRQVQDICCPDMLQADQLNKQHQVHEAQEPQENEKTPETVKDNSERISSMLDKVEEDQNNKAKFLLSDYLLPRNTKTLMECLNEVEKVNPENQTKVLFIVQFWIF